MTGTESPYVEASRVLHQGEPQPDNQPTIPSVNARERATLLAAVLIISICAITYELIVGTLSSYLLGDSVTQFSFTIGLFLSAMGLGALISRRIQGNELRWFIVVELLTGLFGGSSAAILYAVFVLGEQYYYTVMIVLVAAVGACIGLEIPLLTRIVARRADLSKALADVMSIDYLGALVASIAFPVILLPLFGVTQTSFLMGVLNIAVAAICLQMFRERLKPKWTRRLWISTALVGGIMVAGAVFSTDFVGLFERQLYEDTIIYKEQSPYQRIIVTRNAEDMRLYLDGNLQFSSRDEQRYHELLVHPVMSIARSHETVVILGGGDGLAIREVLRYPDVQRVILVDLDPAMTSLAMNFAPLVKLNGDSLRDPRVTVVNEDAYKFIERSSDRYPVVIIDLPDPNNESLSKLYSAQFYRLLQKRLSPDGVFITQATSPYFARKAFWTIANTIRSSDYQIIPLRTYVPSFGEWGYVIGLPNRTAATMPTLKVPEGLQLRFLTPGVLTTAQIFDPETDEVPTEVNTLDNPVLPRYYQEGWRQWE